MAETTEYVFTAHKDSATHIESNSGNVEGSSVPIMAQCAAGGSCVLK